MILQSLVEYYEALAARGEIAKQGWGLAKISYGLNIDSEGNPTVIYSLAQEQRGKKMVDARNMLMPEGAKRSSGVCAQFLWDNAKYILGLDEPEKAEKAKICFAATADKCNEILENAKGENALALKKFFSKWNPDKAREHPVLKPEIDDLMKGGNLTFYVNEKPAAEDKEIAGAWESYKMGRASEYFAQCLVTGKENVPIARLHPSIKGVKGAQSSGAALVSFNAPAYESYGHTEGQGFNAPVGEYAAFAYTTALNSLLADPKHHKQLGDMTVVFWAEDADEGSCYTMSGFLGGENVIDDKDLNDFFDKVGRGEPFDFAGYEIDPENKFYILGLSPNAARLSVRFFLVKTFGDFIKNLRRFCDDFQIIRPSSDKWENLPVWMILRETVNKHSKDKSAPPILAGSFLRSILDGTRYPESLYQNILLRAKADRDDPEKKISIKITRVKAAVIKAFLKNNEESKEAATVSLNEESNRTGYVLGRLFAVLENLQEDANPGLNSTIKDKYFNTACTTPLLVFNIIMRLKNHHIKKLSADRKGRAVNYEKTIGDLMNRIDKIPVRLTPAEQGEFILGYYHQVQKRYTKKEEK